MIVPRQVVVGTAPTLLGAVPAGACTVILTGGTQTAFFGSNNPALSSTGAPLAAGAVVTIPCYPGSAGENLYAAVSGSTTVIGFTVSTAG